MSQSQQPTCIQCGGNDFFIESGYYYCAECNIQSQDIREQVHESFFGLGTKTKAVKPSQQKDSEIKDEKHLSSWEVLNYILKGLVDELILLGCDKELKVVAFQLWVAYLQKLEVAFISTSAHKKPRLGVSFRNKDANLMYGVPKSESILYKNPAYMKEKRKHATTSDDSSIELVSALAKTRRLAKKRKALAKSLYEESMVSESNVSFTTLDSLGSSNKTSVSRARIRYTKHAKEVLSCMMGSGSKLDEEGKSDLYQSVQRHERASFRHTTAADMFAIIRLALFLTSSNVHLCDLFRWSQEGYLSVWNPEKLIPRGLKVEWDLKAIIGKPIFSWLNSTSKSTYPVAKFLGLTNINIDILPLCERFCSELNLPVDTVHIIERLITNIRPDIRVSPRSNYEGRAVALIIFVLKVIFSLDDSTEYFISDAAEKINSHVSTIENLGGERLFGWKGWVESVVCREAVTSTHHTTTREIHYPGSSVGLSSPFLGQWLHAPKKQLLKSSRDKKQMINQSVGRVLEPLAAKGSEPLKPALNACSSMLNQIYPNLPNSVQASIADMTQDSLGVFLDSDRIYKLAENCGLNVIKGTRKDFEKVKPFQWDRVRPRSKENFYIVDVHLTGDKREYESDKLSSKNCTSSDDNSFEKWKCHSSSLEKSETSEEAEERRRKSKKGNLARRVDLDLSPLAETSESLYLPHFQYWFFHGEYNDTSIDIPSFEEVARDCLPSTFFWLLKQCSVLTRQSVRDIYRQLILIEKLFVVHLKTGRFPRRDINIW